MPRAEKINNNQIDILKGQNALASVGLDRAAPTSRIGRNFELGSDAESTGIRCFPRIPFVLWTAGRDRAVMARMVIDEKSPSLREALRRTQSMCMFVWSTERVYILDRSEVFFVKYLLTKVNAKL